MDGGHGARRAFAHPTQLTPSCEPTGSARMTEAPSLRGDAQHRTRNLEVPGSLALLAPRNDSSKDPPPRSRFRPLP